MNRPIETSVLVVGAGPVCRTSSNGLAMTRSRSPPANPVKRRKTSS